MASLPLVGELVRRRFPPVEAYGFWDHYSPGFSRSWRDLEARDVTARVKRRMAAALEAAAPGGERRMFVKITGWPRIGFFHEIFPEARYILITRDGRAAASSALQVPWITVWGGPYKWDGGELDAEQRRVWEASGCSFITLLGLAWQSQLAAQERGAKIPPPGQVLQLKYEEMCADPVEVFRKAAEFSGLPWTLGFEQTIRRAGLRNQNDKWRRDLTEAQQRELTDVIAPELRRYSYL